MKIKYYSTLISCFLTFFNLRTTVLASLKKEYNAAREKFFENDGTWANANIIDNQEIDIATTVGAKNIIVLASPQKTVVFQTVISLAKHNIRWLRLYFDPANTFLRLGKGIELDENNEAISSPWGRYLPGDVIRITSLHDGHVQYLNNATLMQWKYRSAFFNGASVRVELLASDASEPFPSVHVSQIHGSIQKIFQMPKLQSLCGLIDTRTTSSDSRVARIFPVGCTAWITSDARGCLISAGHCFQKDTVLDGSHVLQTNVPTTLREMPIRILLRSSMAQHPHPMHQWAIDPKSIHRRLSFAVDYSYFGAFRNPNTGLTLREAAGGEMFELHDFYNHPIKSKEEYNMSSTNEDQIKLQKLPFGGGEVEILGYGLVPITELNGLSQTLQVSKGNITRSHRNNLLSYRADTQPGVSGAAVVLRKTNTVVAVHNNGGCFAKEEDLGNSGLLLSHSYVQKTLRSPKGVCATGSVL